MTRGAIRPYRNKAIFSALASIGFLPPERGAYGVSVPGLNTSGVCCAGRMPGGRSQRATSTVGSEKSGPAEQVHTQPVEQETVRRHPARGLEHGQGSSDKIWRVRRRSKTYKCSGKARGLIAKSPNPLLAALEGHAA